MVKSGHIEIKKIARYVYWRLHEWITFFLDIGPEKRNCGMLSKSTITVIGRSTKPVDLPTG